MHISFRSDEEYGVAPERDMGVHVHGHQVDINPEANGSYLSLESLGVGALYRLRRDRLAIQREEIPGGNVTHDEDGHIARWWQMDDLGRGPYQAIVTDKYGHTMVVYIGFDERGRLWFVDDNAQFAVEELFLDYPRDDDLFGYDFGNAEPGCGYPGDQDFAAIARTVPTALAAD